MMVRVMFDVLFIFYFKMIVFKGLCTVKYLVCTFKYEKIYNFISLSNIMKKKKIIELTMAAESEDNYVELNSLLDPDDPFNNLVNEISKKIKKRNK